MLKLVRNSSPEIVESVNDLSHGGVPVRSLLLGIGLCSAFLMLATDVDGEVCRSTKYPKLVMDANVVRNAEAFLDEVSQKYRLSINNSFRVTDNQASIYRDWLKRRGTSNPGPPAAKPGKSRHEAGFAFDLNGLGNLTFIHWNRVLNAGEHYGFSYRLGDFPDEGVQKFDLPHFEADPMDYGLTLDQALEENQTTSPVVHQCAWKPNPSSDEKLYLDRITILEAHFFPEQWSGQQPIYIDALLDNTGDRAIHQIELRVEVRDSLGETLDVRFLHPMHSDGQLLEPGKTLNVRSLFGRLYDSRKDGHLSVSISNLKF